jgi:hypothetical protein
MNRRLVLTSEGAGHPFRRSLPPRVLQRLPQHEPEVAAAMARGEDAERPLWDWREEGQRFASDSEGALILPAAESAPASTLSQDLRHFAMAYAACFVAVSLFIL